MRIALLEDDKEEALQFEEALKSWDPTRTVEHFTAGSPLIEAAVMQPPFTIAFLDIYLPKESGVEIGARLREISPDTEIVFTTTSAEHAVEAFGIGAVHYLLKPVTTDGIRESFARVAQKHAQLRPTLTVKIGRDMRTFYMDKIIALVSADHYTQLLLSGGEQIAASSAITELTPLLDSRFIKLRRGLVVNMEFIETMTADSCRLFNGEVILLSRKERASIRSAYNAWIFNRLAKKGDRGW